MQASAAKTLAPRKLAPWTRGALGLALVFAPMVVAAMENPHRAPKGPSPVVQRLLAEMAAKPQTPVRKELVWSGSDIDGDGAPDFANPTGGAPRGHDEFGDGQFGARRDGGSRSHEGVDYVATAGQDVQAPISGYVTKIGYAYAGSSDLKFVEISNPALGYVARAFYVKPGVEVGQAVRLGETIGTDQSLQAHYPGITDHVHLEVMQPGGERVNAAELITRKLVAQA
ncbi:M23 family metallopeptidase [Caulobacter sp. UNC279MFTsu5.1]|uniref:M23 family metallopeptidase n=1 Tax=Caulobacter sp. UNC279MFTsu5.1 TaxID=1502775 RepID=UPI0008E0291F|nr:M23 family metallopeptidase [Caulobacter sp. UNC279MFTsu5.1]SFJ05597.1 Peptidase family M23 [Caulobacter sp. UNC279MFTsu5.1]